MNLRFIETFLWVARLGSFRAAAERLNTTQAAVSNRIASLEADLGQELFERMPGGVRLSAVGQRAIVPAEDLMRSAMEFRVAVGRSEQLRATVRIGTIDSIVHSWLPQFIERVREQYPGLTLDLDVDTSRGIAREIMERRIDLALLMGPVLEPGLRSVDLGQMDCAWVAAPKFGLGDRKIGLEDLVDLPILTFSRNSDPHIWLVRQFEELRLRQPAISNSNSLSAVLRLALEGVGIALVAKPVVAQALANGALQLLDVTPPFPPLTMHAVFADHGDNVIPAALSEVAALAAFEAQG
jgi:DNA-binding transcriptional LysR family regulator